MSYKNVLIYVVVPLFMALSIFWGMTKYEHCVGVSGDKGYCMLAAFIR